MYEITATEKRQRKNGNWKNGQRKIGQPENSATKNDRVGLGNTGNAKLCIEETATVV